MTCPPIGKIPPADPFPIDALGSILGNAAGAIDHRAKHTARCSVLVPHTRAWLPMPTSSFHGG